MSIRQANAHRRAVPAALAVLVAVVACGSDLPGGDLADYEASIHEWRDARRAALLKPTGYVSLVGIYWLDRESTRFGAAADNDIVFPGDAAPYIGEFRITPDGVLLVPQGVVDLREEDRPVSGSVLIADDTTERPVMIRHRSLAWTISKRDGRYAVRLHDFENPALAVFPELPYFPIDPDWQLTARFERYPEPRIADVETVVEGLGYHPEAPGRVIFEVGGDSYDLEAYASGDRLFFVFADRTSGRETYGAGRFLYAAAPGEDGETVLDFNRAYSPPCAFNDFSTCPIAMPRNRLPIGITAGEQYEPAAYVGTASIH